MISNQGTGGMVSSVVLFKPRIRLFACTHPSVSNSLDRNEWLAYKHQSTARVQTHLEFGSLLYASISFHPVFQTYLDCGSCLRTLISIQLYVLTRLDYGFVSVCISRQPFDQTRLDCGSCCLRASSSPCVLNTFGMWILVCVHASVSCTVFKHVWVMVPCLGTSICLLPPWSNTFGFWSQTRFDYGSLSAYASVFNPLFRKCLDCGSLSVLTHPSPALFKHV